MKIKFEEILILTSFKNWGFMGSIGWKWVVHTSEGDSHPVLRLPGGTSNLVWTDF